MAKRPKPEEIVAKLRQADVLISQGQSVAEAIRAIRVTEETYYRWGSPWENGFIESFNARLGDELLNGEIFYTLKEAQAVIESWRCHYNTIRPHASLGYRPPAPEVFLPAFAAWPARSAKQPMEQRPTLH